MSRDEKILESNPILWWRRRMASITAALAPPAGSEPEVPTYSNAGSMIFDGTTDATAGNITTLDGRSTATLALWIRFDNMSGVEYIFHRYGSTSHRQLAMLHVSGSMRCYFPSAVNTAQYSNFPMGLSADQWALLVMRVDGDEAVDADKVRFWVNGSEITATLVGAFSDPQTFTTPGVPGDMRAGTLNGAASPFNSGLINKMAIWTSALTPAQIETTLYNAGTDHNWADSLGTSLVHLWEPGDSGSSASTILDLVGSADMSVTNGSISSQTP